MSIISKILGEDSRVHRSTVVLTVEGTGAENVVNIAKKATDMLKEFALASEKESRLSSSTMGENLKCTVAGVEDPLVNSDVYRAHDGEEGTPVKPTIS